MMKINSFGICAMSFLPSTSSIIFFHPLQCMTVTRCTVVQSRDNNLGDVQMSVNLLFVHQVCCGDEYVDVVQGGLDGSTSFPDKIVVDFDEKVDLVSIVASSTSRRILESTFPDVVDDSRSSKLTGE